MGTHRKGDKYRGQGGSAPDPDKIRWRVEWRDEEGKFHSEPFNARILVDEKLRELQNRGISGHVVNVR